MMNVTGYHGMPSFKVRPKHISRHGTQYIQVRPPPPPPPTLPPPRVPTELPCKWHARHAPQHLRDVRRPAPFPLPDYQISCELQVS